MDTELCHHLRLAGFDNPVILAAAFDEDDELRDELTGFLSQLGLADNLIERLDKLERLHSAATKPAEQHQRRYANTSDLDLASDLIAISRRAAVKEADTARAAAVAEHLSELPNQWRGKHYRRKEVARNPQEQEEAEDKKAARWAKEVLGLLLEADLPFADSARRSRGGIDGPSMLRCCRGLRPNTQKKRVSDWRPYRRWLLAEGAGPFPKEQQQVLDYFEVQWVAAAPRTWYKSFLAALTFLEMAGEVPRQTGCRRPLLSATRSGPTRQSERS